MSQIRLASEFFREMRLRADKEGHPPWHPLARPIKSSKQGQAKKKARSKRAKKAAKTRKANKTKAKAKRESAKFRKQKSRRRAHAIGDMVLIHTWVCDADPCPDCEDLDGMSIEDGEEFPIETYDGSGSPPVHPNCNCQVESTWVEHGGDVQ